MTLRIFESVFYKSPIRACSFENSLATNQNVRSYGQTFNHRALRICKKRIPKKCSCCHPFFLINISSYLLSDSYNKNTIQITTQCVCYMILVNNFCIYQLLRRSDLELISMNYQSHTHQIMVM